MIKQFALKRKTKKCSHPLSNIDRLIMEKDMHILFHYWTDPKIPKMYLASNFSYISAKITVSILTWPWSIWDVSENSGLPGWFPELGKQVQAQRSVFATSLLHPTTVHLSPAIWMRMNTHCQQVHLNSKDLLEKKTLSMSDI